MLALYHYQTCWACMRTRNAIARLGVADQVEMRDVRKHPEYMRELAAARGRTRVPVLRITTDGGGDVWMPESRDIIAYLEQRFERR